MCGVLDGMGLRGRLEADAGQGRGQGHYDTAVPCPLFEHMDMYFPGVLLFFLGSSFGLRVRLVETTGQIRNGACCADNTRYTQISRTKKQNEVFILGGRQS